MLLIFLGTLPVILFLSRVVDEGSHLVEHILQFSTFKNLTCRSFADFFYARFFLSTPAVVNLELSAIVAKFCSTHEIIWMPRVRY